MNIACPICIPCIDPSEPTANYSAEIPDVDHIFCYGSGNGSLEPGAGRNWNVGNCTITWGPVSCFSTAEEGCLACVENAKWTCRPEFGALPGFPPFPPDYPGDPENISPIIGPDPNDPTGPLVPRQIFWNFADTCIRDCPDGLSFSFTVPPLRFAAYSLGEAQAKAHSYACKLAAQRKVCLGDLSPSECCINQSYDGTLSAAGNFLSLTANVWSIVSGGLPAGLELNTGLAYGGKHVHITGTPTQGGTFNFTVRVAAPNGDFMQKAYTLCVIEIKPDTLPDGTVGAVYSETLTATACASPALSWQLAAWSSLPPGLTLDEETGIISGTPTASGTFPFTIILQTQAT